MQASVVSVANDLIRPLSIHYTGTFDPDKVANILSQFSEHRKVTRAAEQGSLSLPCAAHGIRACVKGTVAIKPCGCTSYEHLPGQRLSSPS